jgi:hypothetical protein
VNDSAKRTPAENFEEGYTGEEMLVTDIRAALRPSEHVEQKLATILKSSVPVSQLQKARPIRRP